MEIITGEYISLIGPNNHGKSNVLGALEFALSTSSKPDQDDFFRCGDSAETKMWVELTFYGLTDQEQNTFKRYILDGDIIRIRKKAEITEGQLSISYNGWAQQPEDDWLRVENVGDYTMRENAEATPLAGRLPKMGRISKADVERAQEQYISENRDRISFQTKLEASPLLGQRNVGGGVLPEFFLIPAVRDLTEEVKIKTSTNFGRLMNLALREMAGRDQRFIEAKTRLNEVVAAFNQRQDTGEPKNELAQLESDIEQELNAWGVKVNIEIQPPEIEKLFELGTDIHIDDGVKTKAEKKGHGLQRAMIFSLLKSWSAALRKQRAEQHAERVTSRQQSETVIFAMEEPELFLHPHAQRRLARSLRDIASTADHQVITCTHSTHFIELSSYRDIAIISRTNPQIGSEIRQCNEELFPSNENRDKKDRFHMAHWINPDRGELFFARKVIFVEGETEKVVLPFIAEKLGLDWEECSVIDCGSKYNIPLYIKISNAFKIPYVVIHDEDPLPQPIPDDWDQDKVRAKTRTFELNQEIRTQVDSSIGAVASFSPDFEGAARVSRSQGHAKGKALAALEHLERLQVEALPDRLVEVARIAFS